MARSARTVGISSRNTEPDLKLRIDAVVVHGKRGEKLPLTQVYSRHESVLRGIGKQRNGRLIVPLLELVNPLCCCSSSHGYLRKIIKTSNPVDSRIHTARVIGGVV